MLDAHVAAHPATPDALSSRPARRGAARAAPVTTWRFWSAYWTTFRPYLTFVSGAAALVGLAFTGSSPTRCVAAFVPLFLSYGFGQAITDCFQTDTDALSSPYRPLVRGIVSREQVLVVSSVALAASAAVLAALNVAILVPAALAVAGLLLYTPLKRTWWGGPPCNAAVVALLPVMARLSDGASIPAILGTRDAAALAAGVAMLLLAYGDFVVIGYLKDVSADRATGYRTFPVVFGWRAAVIYGDLLAIGAGAAATYALALLHTGAIAWATLLAAVVVGARAHRAAHRMREEHEAHRPIVGVVRALILASGSIVVAARPNWTVAFAGFLGVFELAIRWRPERTQV